MARILIGNFMGPPGPQGPEGPQGPQGPQGPAGDSLLYSWSGTSLGVKQEGDASYVYTDLEGPVGPEGPPGPEGPVGPEGPQGEPGPQGPEGPIGPEGPGLNYNWSGTSLGVKNENETTYVYTDLEGPVGPEGPQGPVGPEGPQGPTGPEGPQGPVGPEGPQGPQGPQGDSIMYDWSGTQLGVKIEGDASYVYTDLEGPQGPIGPEGPQGPTGPEGPQGPVGPEGPQGPTGPQGDSLMYSWSGTLLGVKVEGDASYTYTDLEGPQGPTGPEGPQGPEGPVGPEGPQGPPGPNLVDSTTEISADVIKASHIGVTDLADISTNFGGKFDVNAASQHIRMTETDSSKTWHIESSGGNFNIAETGVAVWATIEPGGRLVLEDNLYVKGGAQIDGEVLLGNGNGRILAASGTFWHQTAGTEVRFSKYKSTTLVDAHAADFVTGSLEEYKTNISEVDSALDVIKRGKVHRYKLRSDEKGIDHYGFVIGEGYDTPDEIVNENGDGVSQYSLASLTYQAVQEQQELIERLQKEVAELRK